MRKVAETEEKKNKWINNNNYNNNNKNEKKKLSKVKEIKKLIKMIMEAIILKISWYY